MSDDQEERLSESPRVLTHEERERERAAAESFAMSMTTSALRLARARLADMLEKCENARVREIAEVRGSIVHEEIKYREKTHFLIQGFTRSKSHGGESAVSAMTNPDHLAGYRR